MSLYIKRAYEDPSEGDGYRVLIDRLWPRGVSKDRARIDQWMKELAPSTELRRWFGHDPSRWEDFRTRYFRELDARPDEVAELRNLVKKRHVTLVYAAKDEAHNNAVALSEYLKTPRVVT
jgi:uncharacterized protein YeaO (DUF488 family)